MPCTKLKSKRIKDINIKPFSLNLIEDKVGSTLEHFGTRKPLPKYNPSSAEIKRNNR